MSFKFHNDSLRQLFTESHRALRRYVRRLVDSPATADEIVQEAFLRTFEHGEHVNTPRAFLFSIARNLATDSRRRRQAAKTYSIGDIDGSGLLSPEASPEDQALVEEQSRLLKEAIEHLPLRCRSAFALKVFHECSYKEISVRMGLSPKTVENHVARALRETHAYLRRRYR